eukprot:3368661-Amphidinium_carterae.1
MLKPGLFCNASPAKCPLCICVWDISHSNTQGASLGLAKNFVGCKPPERSTCQPQTFARFPKERPSPCLHTLSLRLDIEHGARVGLNFALTKAVGMTVSLASINCSKKSFRMPTKAVYV